MNRWTQEDSFLLGEMILVCSTLSFIDEENSSSDTIESVDTKLSAAVRDSLSNEMLFNFQLLDRISERINQLDAQPYDCVWSDGAHFASVQH